MHDQEVVVVFPDSHFSGGRRPSRLASSGDEESNVRHQVECCEGIYPIALNSFLEILGHGELIAKGITLNLGTE